jgi:hypothetical protein
MKYLAIALLVMGIIAVHVSSEPNQTPRTEKQSAKEQSPPSPPTITNNNYESSTNSQNTHDNSPKWYASFKRPEWLLVIAAFLTFVFIGWQAVETRRAAQAAQASAEAFIAENRPWVLISRDQTLDKIDGPFLIPAERLHPTDQHPALCEFLMQNYGKTPAKIIAFQAELQIGESRDKPPSTEIFRTTELRPYPYIFPQGEPERRDARLKPERSATAEEERAIVHDATKSLWLCGVIKYRNAFEPREDKRWKLFRKSIKPVEYETRFCYVYTNWLKPSRRVWAAAGPSEYNQAT